MWSPVAVANSLPKPRVAKFRYVEFGTKMLAGSPEPAHWFQHVGRVGLKMNDSAS
jgi:hypothetical protein